MSELTAERLRELVHYDPASGAFVWLAPPAQGKGKLGALAGGVNDRGYVRITIDCRRYRGHRLAWLYVHGTWPATEIDHINGIRSDNRIENLRPASASQNHANSKKNSSNTSGLKGAVWHRTKQRWGAKITKDRKGRHLGYFNTKEEAHAAYVSAATHLFGGFARAE